MSTLNYIGLNTEKAGTIAQKLNILLANYQQFYINVRGYHWNIRGHKFFELHQKFEELYDDLYLKIDEIAERILTLGHTPLHSYSVYQKHASIQESQDVVDGYQAVRECLEAFKIIMPLQRELLDLTDEANDEGTNSIMSDYIREQEKLIWMYDAFLHQS